MSFLTTGARKFTSWITSSPPVTVLGKRKAVSWEDEESDSSSDYDNDSIGSDDERSPLGEIECFSEDYEKSLPATKHTVTSAEVTHSRNASFLQNNATLRRVEQAIHGKYICEQDIQKELEAKSRQEHIGTVKPQSKRVTPEITKTASVTRRVTFEPTAGTSKPKSKPAVNPSPPKVPTRKALAITPKPTTPKAQWADKPNTRARELLKNGFHSPAAIVNDLQEPEYACRDIEIRDGVWKMMDQIKAFAKEHFRFEFKDKKRLRAAFESMPKETVTIIGCVASGGPAGASGWEDLFVDSDKRQALVCAIIGNVLVEQVFQHMFFGGTAEQIKEVAEIQHTQRNHDGKFPPHLAANEN
jgi:hypothetical protein